MEILTIHLLNRAIAAGAVVLVILLLRFLLRKAPKSLLCLLWAAAALRLVLPFSIPSPTSLLPSAEPIPTGIVYAQEPRLNTGIAPLDGAINPILSETLRTSPEISVNPAQIVLSVCGTVWLIGFCLMLLYAALTSFLLGRKTRDALLLEDGIYLCGGLKTPFLYGVFSPRILLPASLPEEARGQAILHELAHKKRRDPLLKLIAYLLLSVFWFQPLLWVAFLLFCRDVEYACDEAVVKDMEAAKRADYSQAMLDCASGGRSPLFPPLAFGEVGVKARVKKVLAYEKPALWRSLLCAACAVLLVLCFLTDPILAVPSSERKTAPDGAPFVLSENDTIKTLPAYPELRAEADRLFAESCPAASLIGVEKYGVRALRFARGVNEKDYGPNADTAVFVYCFCLYGIPTEESCRIAFAVDKTSGKILGTEEPELTGQGVYSGFLSLVTEEQVRSAAGKIRSEMLRSGTQPYDPIPEIGEDGKLYLTAEIIVPIVTPESLLGIKGCDIDHKHVFLREPVE